MEFKKGKTDKAEYDNFDCHRIDVSNPNLSSSWWTGKICIYDDVRLRDHVLALLKANPLPEPMSEREKIARYLFGELNKSCIVSVEEMADQIIAMRDEK